MMAEQYPKRPKFFAHRFTRLLFKVAAALDLGCDACYLLVSIVHQEDAKGYRGAVGFWNGNLAERLGLRSEDSLSRVRKRCVESGWLHYTPGKKGRAATYWVIVPAEYKDMDDACSSEEFTPEFPRKSAGESAVQSAEKPRRKARRKLGESAVQSAEEAGNIPPIPNPIPVPSPIEDSADAVPATAAPSTNVVRMVDPKAKPRDPFFDALASVAQLDPKLAGGRIGKAKAALLAAGYTAADVLAYGELHRRQHGWQIEKGTYKPPTLPQVVEGIAQVRKANGGEVGTRGPDGNLIHGDGWDDLAAQLRRERAANPERFGLAVAS